MREAQESADSDKWMEAARDEYQSLMIGRSRFLSETR